MGSVPKSRVRTAAKNVADHFTKGNLMYIILSMDLVVTKCCIFSLQIRNSENKLVVPLPRTNYLKIALGIAVQLSGTTDPVI